MQRDSRRWLLQYFGIIADCRACTVLKILQDEATPRTVPYQSGGQITIHSTVLICPRTPITKNFSPAHLVCDNLLCHTVDRLLRRYF